MRAKLAVHFLHDPDTWKNGALALATCSLCLVQFKNVTAKKMLAHLAGKAGHAITVCKGLHDESSYGDVEAAAAVSEAVILYNADVRERETNKKRKSAEFSHGGNGAGSSSKRQLLIGESMDDTLVRVADDALCRFFYDAAVAFTKCGRKTFKEAMDAVAQAGPGYRFRGMNYMRCDGLKKEKSRLLLLANKLREEVCLISVPKCAAGKKTATLPRARPSACAPLV
jgi:hypothetical protein